ncbi:MAG: ATP-dependent DNA helicase RecQ [Archangiaceae bacterium]|nr:ATP-dependent DNA helicase RecQ [Archangiaceae bacterium]
MHAEPTPSLSLADGLARHFGYRGFRPGQREVIEAVMAGHNTVTVMPTGAGKSLCYQLPAALLGGVTLVVSPLIALMRDQVEQLQARGLRAAYLSAAQSEGERLERLARVRAGELKLLYVSPERLRSEPLLEVLEGRLSLFAVDEAHCISAWGHDFRPDYALLGAVRKRLLPPRTVALTATATPEVRDDIARVLLLKEPRVFVSGFDRPNLFLEVSRVDGDADKRQACLALAREQAPGLVYCSTRKSAESLHAALVKSQVDAVLYHAGLDDDARHRAQDTFMSSARAVAVATNAFGMGVDKADVRFVAHAGIPRAVEAYYQEIGRAGRDGKPAHAVLLFNHSDVFTQERLIQGSHPSQTLIADVWKLLRARGPRFDQGLHVLANHLGASELEVGSAVRILERARLLARGRRGEGAWTFTVADGAAATQPRSPEARAVLEALCALAPVGTASVLELEAIVARCHLSLEKLRHAIGLLERGGLLQVKRPFAGRTIEPLRELPFEALGLDLGQVRAQERRALLLLRRMTEYAYERRCRRAFVLRYFGERPEASRCGNCDVCRGPRLEVSSRAPGVAPEPEPGEKNQRFSALAFEELRKWRRGLSTSLCIAPYLIFNDDTLKNLAAALPVNRDEFITVKGTGELSWARFGAKVVEVSTLARAAGEQPYRPAAVVKKRLKARYPAP